MTLRMDVTALFPTPLMRITGLLPRGKVAGLCAQLQAADTEHNAKSDLLSHTEVVTPDDNPLYRDLSERVTPALSEFGGLLFGERLQWTVKEMWMNTLRPGGQQALHAHANSFISGVVYLSETHPSARTVFYRDLGGRDFAFKNDGPEARQGPFNSPKWATPSMAPGDAVLFPSYMLHEVPKNQGGTRMTLAFNAIPDRLRSWGYDVRFTSERA